MVTPSRWRQNGIDRLSDPDYPLRFLGLLDIAKLVAAAGGPAWATVEGGEPSRSAYRFARELCDSRDLIKIQRDLYANMRARPIPHPEEAAHLMRNGAVISLQTVLGQAGALNNPTPVIYALHPMEEHPGNRRSVVAQPAEDGVPIDFGVYRFFAVKRSYLEAGDPRDRLVKGSYAKATPERALVDWIRLSQYRNTKLSAPPLDIDVDLLDLKRLARVAAALDLRDQVETWLHAVKSAADIDEDYGIPGVGR